jgi:RHH-type proline utilization regulon transcriptional repressor/proline dehydrogenase/delta 1-pyrroline-5-carboxylate dehydrogenase
MLHGMADELKQVVIDRRLRLREYVPVGEMIPGMAYLVRRLLENTSNESWLRAGFLENVSVDQLLSPPLTSSREDPGIAQFEQAPQRHELSVAVKGIADSKPFFTEPHHDWSDARQREHFAAAIRGASVPTIANDGTVGQAQEMLARAADAFPKWRGTDSRERAKVLIRAAAIMRSRRDELAGIMIKEAGKPWPEADGDVCEAIDFCEFYARESVPLFEPRRLGKFVGEFNEQWHQPRGVAVVISPWNFPLAICCGMTTAALVTGNAVIVKPAEQTPGIAKVMCDILWEAGAPRDVLQFIAAPGETVGAALVRDPRVALIAFTGSKAVGLDILQAAGVTPDNQPFVKKVICEMGGKNAIIVDASADLDEAVVGVRASAFGFAGQKCSACSRVVALESAHDTFLHRLIESTRSMVVGDPLDPATDVGPVIDHQAAQKIREYIEIGMREGKLEFASTVGGEIRGKPLIGPHIFSGIRPEHRLAQEEIFGPVLAVMKARDFDEALKIANGSSYKLTGGVFSRKPSHLERAKCGFRVGDLYLNRGITGALVGRQPFGGFGLSGVGSQAGGREYLLQFVEPRACSENTLRRGFAPGMDPIDVARQGP